MCRNIYYHLDRVRILIILYNCTCMLQKTNKYIYDLSVINHKTKVYLHGLTMKGQLETKRLISGPKLFISVIKSPNKFQRYL